ncbi:imidazolonepropionase [Silvibacterium dinghuense]|uniref:Imidazolonepropionase n=2 Tax=Silvibacterium dinghuense TaxID=1560006 RepID=A0A4Q1SEI7_9BACT|nr:imidazolonepropionase [Silvibacterium dinghuense]RXS95696.1 imidazolonepropionase [Silvibacterium dinghuense]
MASSCETVWRDARLLTMRDGRFGLIEDGVIACRARKILYAGPANRAPKFEAEKIVSCDGRLITPGLIDPHTHLIFGGSRAHEFELRRAGKSYREIAEAGGGIWSTVCATREASDAALLKSALVRLDSLIAEGVTTIEVKSGYGLSLEQELRLLRLGRQLEQERNVKISTTLLAAHVVPYEYKADPDRYVSLICDEIIPAAVTAGLVDAVDVFCESIAFSLAQSEMIFRRAREVGLPVKVHAEQLTTGHGAALAARFGALSADHLEYLDESGIQAMAANHTVATLLPGAFYFLRETQVPPVEALRKAGIPIALATDCNPGTSPLSSLLTVLNLAAVLFRMSAEECIAGVTCHAARALGLQDSHGSLEEGKVCDLAIWNVSNPAELVYNLGLNPLHTRVRAGHE